MSDEIFSHGEDFAPDMGGNDEVSLSVFTSLMSDLEALESDDAFTEQELLILGSLETITSTVDFHKLINNKSMTPETVVALYNKLTSNEDRTAASGSSDEAYNLDVLFSKILKLNPLRTEVNFL